MDLRKVADAVPEYPAFLTVEELNASTRKLTADFPDLVTVRPLGKSQGGFPLELISIGNGPKSALVVGTPHPNEPIGCMTIEFLTRHLCENNELREELGYTWHFIKSIDPDGLKLNEGWLKGPFTISNYLNHFFREALFDQAEYSFPADYKILHFDNVNPQTQAWIKAQELTRPDFQYSLHNSELGGVFYLISDDAPPLYDLFGELPGWFNLALDPVGEPGITNQAFAPAVSPLPSIKGIIDELEAAGTTDPSSFWKAGFSSYEFARQYNTYSLVVEMPYWDNQRFLDQTPTNTSYHELIKEYLQAEDNSHEWLDPRIEAARALLLPGNNLFLNAVQEQIKNTKRRLGPLRESLQKPEEDRMATQADIFLYRTTFIMFQQRPLTMFKRMLEEEIAKGNSNPTFVELHGEASTRLEDVCKVLEETIEYRNIPIRELAAVQACAGLATAAFVRDR
ncbi:MAG: hypothetical protein JWP00_1179 [Chloroflexi bacterium]|jgi:hypothetical protein|nr:hypothetical protein [Chloroflexota bacterium]